MSCCLTLVFGGNCHGSSFKLSPGDLIFLCGQHIYSVMAKINIAEFVKKPH